VPADHELRRLVLGREEPITIRPADLLEPQVDAARNQRGDGRISTDGSTASAWVVPTDEERMIARYTRETL